MSASNSAQQRGNGRGEQRDDDAARQNITFSSDEIAQRAYQIYERDGRMDGRDMDHWLQAERELREERERASANTAQENRSALENRGASIPDRSPRPDEAPRSARRHQQSMA